MNKSIVSLAGIVTGLMALLFLLFQSNSHMEEDISWHSKTTNENTLKNKERLDNHAGLNDNKNSQSSHQDLSTTKSISNGEDVIPFELKVLEIKTKAKNRKIRVQDSSIVSKKLQELEKRTKSTQPVHDKHIVPEKLLELERKPVSVNTMTNDKLHKYEKEDVISKKLLRTEERDALHKNNFSQASEIPN